MKVVFVGGVHGVGKSTCCARVAQVATCLHVTASDVIRRERAGAVAASSKLVADVEGNQSLLIRGFMTLKSEAIVTAILLDGHFAMRDTQGDIQTVSPHVFRALGIDQVVCVVDEPRAIVDRIRHRDGQAPTHQEIANLQNAELRSAQLVATALSVPFTSLQCGDVEGLRRLVLAAAE
jgi:adenylate kinase